MNYNAGRLLWRCLESVMSALADDCEVVLVDNASSDGSADRLELLFPRVTMVRLGTNAGFGAGNNLGARLAHGQYLVFLNPDTIPQPGWLEALLAPLETEASVGLTTAKILLADQPERVNACGNDVHLTGLTLCRGMGEPAARYVDEEEVGAVSGAAFAIRREVFEVLGGFDEDFFMYMEDTDLSLRARLAGWRIMLAPESQVWHTYRLRFGPHKVFYQERNRYVMLLKCLRWPTLVALLPALLLAEGVTWGFVLWSDRRNIANKLRAYVAIARQWRLIGRRRAATQALRRATDRALLRHSTHRLAYGQAGTGAVAQWAAWLFDPCFYLLRAPLAGLLWW